jgi:hypothetical protein
MSFNCVLREWVEILCSACPNLCSHLSIFYHSTTHLIYHVFVNDIKQFMLEKKEKVSIYVNYTLKYFTELYMKVQWLYSWCKLIFITQWYWQMINKGCCLRSSLRSIEFSRTSMNLLFLWNFMLNFRLEIIYSCQNLLVACRILVNNANYWRK